MWPMWVNVANVANWVNVANTETSSGDNPLLRYRKKSLPHNPFCLVDDLPKMRLVFACGQFCIEGIADFFTRAL
jgi:hypothetical protein